MGQWVRVTLMGAFASALLGLLPYAISPANAQTEIHLNSSNVQVVHNTPANTDVLNMSLNVESDGDSGDCEGGADDLLETGVHIGVSPGTCLGFFISCIPFGCPTIPFDYGVAPYVEHDIGSTSYGTFFGLNGSGTVASKIVALATPLFTCGTWSINLQATGLDLSSITDPHVALFINDSDGDGDNVSAAACFDVTANIGNGIVKPHHGVRKTRHR